MKCMSKIVEISESNGFEHFCCDNGIGSKIFIKNDYVYKVCERNSLERVRSDYKEYRKICGEHVDKLQESYFTECLYGSKVYACIKQKRINGKTLNQLGREGLILLLGIYENRALPAKSLISRLMWFTSLQQTWAVLVLFFLEKMTLP